MFQILLGVAGVVAVGAYLLEDKKSSYKSAKRDYERTYVNTKEEIYSSYDNAKRKIDLDNLFKLKRLKQDILRQIKGEMKNINAEYGRINHEIRSKKSLLDAIFAQKKAQIGSKKAIQKQINTTLAIRKELFEVQAILKAKRTTIIQKQESLAQEMRDIQQNINALSLNRHTINYNH